MEQKPPEQKPPVPVAKSFLVRRGLFQDTDTKQYILVGTFSELIVLQVPTVTAVNVFAEVTSFHGSYFPSVELRDMEDQVVWNHAYAKPFETTNPLGLASFCLRNLPLYAPRVGKYDLLLLFNKEEVARRPLWVKLPKQPGP